MESDIVRLESPVADLVIRCFPAVEILYWGKHLNHFSAADAQSLARPVPNGRLDVDTPLTLLAETGRGLFGSPGIEGHRDGLDHAPIFQTREVWQPDAHTLTVVSDDRHAGLQVTSDLILDAVSGVLQVRHHLKNLKASSWQVNRLAITLPVPERATDVLAWHGRWIREFQPHRQTLTHGGFIQENRRGRSSHEYFPAMVMGDSQFNEMQGDVWGVHLGWSGNHRLRADIKIDGRRLIQAEALYFPGEIALAAGETLTTPWLYATYSAQGLNGMSQQFHQYVRAQILHFPKHHSRPVHLNTWEGIYFEHDPHYIMQMATEAAAIGVERFIIDDGWFRGRHYDRAGLGDWYLDRQKYPEGLEPVIDHVKALGMEFGIWIEPEMINPDSDLYRAHPDWVLGLDGYNQPTGRYQYVLDLCRPEVFDYLVERMSWLLGEHAIDYVKWDMNRELVQPAHEGKASADAQTHQYYALLDTLRQRFPHIEFESCASGGGRIDYEVLKRCHRFWASDNNDALERQTIQRGMSYFFPLEIMGAHIGQKHCYATGRDHTFEFRGITALFGHMGIELDPVKTPADEKAGFARYVALYQRLRPLLHEGKFWRVEQPDPTTLVQGVVATDQRSAVFEVAQLAMPDYALAGTLRIPGLNPQVDYQVTLLDSPELKPVIDGGHTMRVIPQWLSEPMIFSGGWLAEAGLALPVLDPASAILIELKQQ
jgi:alpha-galactosidase